MKTIATQDNLYDFIKKHDLKMTRLAQLIGKSDDVVTSCFKHHKDWHGRPRHFNREHIAAINAALPVIAREIEERKLEWGTDMTQVETNRWGNTYDKAVLEQLKNLGFYINLRGMMTRVLGWKKSKKDAVMSQPNSNSYGAISKDDVIKINTELATVVNVLSDYEVVAEEV